MNNLPGMLEPWSQKRPPGATSRWFARLSPGLSSAVLLLATIFLNLSGWSAPAEPAVARTSRLPLPAAAPVNASPRFQDFVGSDACAKCHAKEFAVWEKSTHGQAGGRPDDTKIIARFDGQPLEFKDAIVTPTTNRLGEYVFQLALEGRPALEIKVDAVVGGGHMLGGGTQSFFNQYPDGTVRFLPFDFIRRENLWFVQLRKDLTWVPISKEIALQSDLANWPPHRVLGTATEFSNCQNCHGSQITLRYDEPTRRYETRIQTLKINCESCHGPGRRHIDLVSQPGFDKLPDIGMKPLATLTKDESVMVCLQCHAKKDAIREEEYLPGASLEDYFSLKLGLLGDSPYRVDGRVRSFDYQGNHLFSDCYRNGSMTCVDCHDPHGQGYRDVFLKPLTGKLNNGQCTSCHASKAVAPERHSHHKPDSAGNQCVSCHMPFLQHQGVGTHLAFARSDHSIPIPRPAFDHQLGIENACQKCHQDKDLAWQEARVGEWYGELKPHPKAIASLLQARETADPQSAAKQLLLPDSGHLMAQTAALATWIERFLSPNQTRVDPDVVQKLKTLAQSPDLDLKSLALMSLHVGYDQSAGVRPFLIEQLRTLGSREEAVRNRWAIAADKVGSALAARGDLPNAILSLDKSLEANPSNYVSMSHLALAHLKAGNASNAVVWLKNAIQLKPYKATLHFQLAQTYAQQQQIPAAIRSLEEGLKYAPNDATARRMLQYLRQP